MSDLISRQDAIKAIANVDMQVYERDAAVGRRLYLTPKKMIAVIEALPSAEPERKWIPVTERLPEEEYVLISKKPTKLSGSKWCVTIAIRTADPRNKKVNWRDIGFSVIPDDNVLAWMPLPEPWRDE